MGSDWAERWKHRADRKMTPYIIKEPNKNPVLYKDGGAYQFTTFQEAHDYARNNKSHKKLVNQLVELRNKHSADQKELIAMWSKKSGKGTTWDG